MGSLLIISIKTKIGTYENYTISISDETNQYGQNVSMWVEQNEDQRTNKEKRIYVGNGKVIWTDGKIATATKQDKILEIDNGKKLHDDNENKMERNKNDKMFNSELKTNVGNIVNSKPLSEVINDNDDDLPF